MKMQNDTLTSKYELFSRLMMEENLYLVKDLTFSALCDWIGAEEKPLDTLISDELGASGQEIMATFRENFPAYLRKKYGEAAFRKEP